MADQDDLEAVCAVSRHFQVDLGDQWAGGVEDAESALLRVLAHALGHAVGAEYDGRAGRDLVELVDEDGAAPFQAVDHEAVVHHFVTHIDGRSVELQDALDDLDGPVDTGAEAAWVGEEDVHD